MKIAPKIPQNRNGLAQSIGVGNLFLLNRKWVKNSRLRPQFENKMSSQLGNNNVPDHSAHQCSMITSFDTVNWKFSCGFYFRETSRENKTLAKWRDHSVVY